MSPAELAGCLQTLSGVAERWVPRLLTQACRDPGSAAWEDTLSDEHRYQRIPQLPEQIQNLRDYQPGKPVFLSEYGVASAVDDRDNRTNRS